MNSEILEKIEREQILTDLNRRKLEEKSVVNGNLAEDFYEHPFWKKIEDILRVRLHKLINSMESVTTLKELYKLQAEMKIVNLVLNSPKSFIEGRELVRKRHGTDTSKR